MSSSGWMKKEGDKVRAYIRCWILVFLLAISFSSSREASPKLIQVASIAFLTGRADLIREAVVSSAKLRMALFYRDMLKTYLASRLDVLYVDNTRVSMGENSILAIERPSKVGGKTVSEAVLWSGRVRANVAKRKPNEIFQISTPVAVAGVEGTDLGVEILARDGTTGVACFEGQVKVWNKSLPEQAVVLSPGQYVVVRPNEPPQAPVQIGEEERREKWEPLILPSPSPIYPPNGSRIPFGSSFDISWADVQGAESYRVQVSRDISFSSIVLDVSDLRANRYTVKGLDQGTYYWRVAAAFQRGVVMVEAGFSSPMSFDITPAPSEGAPPAAPPPPPEPIPITVEFPKDGIVLNQTSITVSGMAIPDSTIRVNEVQGEADAQGRFQIRYNLKPNADNVLVIDASKGERISESIIRRVRTDLIPPRLSLSPDVKSIVNKQAYVLSGSSSEPCSFVIRVNGREVAAIPFGVSNIKVPINLSQDGRNVISVEARDEAGNVAEAQKELFLDTQPPIITVARPIPGENYVTTRGEYPVSGTVSEKVVSITANGIGLKFDPKNNSFSGMVPISPGKNRIFIEAEDEAGNRARVGPIDLTVHIIPMPPQRRTGR
jgi:hypothetical protein